MSLSCSSPSEWLGVSEERKKDRGEATQSFCVVCYKYYLLYTKRLWVNKFAVHVGGTPPPDSNSSTISSSWCCASSTILRPMKSANKLRNSFISSSQRAKEKTPPPNNQHLKGAKVASLKKRLFEKFRCWSLQCCMAQHKRPKKQTKLQQKGDRRYVNCLFLFTSWLKLHVPASLWFHSLLQTIHWPRCQENHRHHSFHVIFPQAQIRHLDLDLLSCIYRPCTNSSPRKEAGSSPTVFKKLLLLVLGNVIWMHRPPPPQPLEA